MAGTRAHRKWTYREMEREVKTLLSGTADDSEILSQMEAIANDPLFTSFVHLWGPSLYRRHRVRFRPFLLAHLPYWTQRSWDHSLDSWLLEVDAGNDIELFRRLYGWKHRKRSAKSQRQEWRDELMRRYRAAESSPEREIVTAKMDLSFALEEAEAVELYRVDPVVARKFILKHLPMRWSYGDDQRIFWEDLYSHSGKQGDAELAMDLYRRQVPLQRWKEDTLDLCRTVSDPDDLVEQLERHHPRGWGLDLADGFAGMIRARSRDVFPYVMNHMQDVVRGWWLQRSGYADILQYSKDRQWWDLWSSLLRVCAKPDEYDNAVLELVLDHSLPDAEITQRLLMLAGISREWNFASLGLAHVRHLKDTTAVAFYRRFPALLHGPFKMHVAATWYGNGYEHLMQAVLEAADEEMLDFMASRVITRSGATAHKLVDQAEKLSHYYQDLLKDESLFTRRAVNVLCQIPAYSIWNYNELIRTNRLARLLFERSSSAYLLEDFAARDLLEAPEIHVQLLGFKALGLDDSRARELASANLDLLLAALLRPLHRNTRLPAFRAVLNAATSLENARRINERARQALDLPDKFYPKEELIGMLGKLLWQAPEVRTSEEAPVVYGMG